MTREKIEAQIERWGGRFASPSELDNFWKQSALTIEHELNAILQDLRNRMYDKGLRPIEFCIFDDPNLRAMSCIIDSKSESATDLIGMSIGLFRKVHDAFSLLLSHPNTFGDYGQPDLED